MAPSFYRQNWLRNRTYLVVPPLDYVLPRPDFALMDRYISRATMILPLRKYFRLPLSGMKRGQRFLIWNNLKTLGEKIDRSIMVEISSVSIFIQSHLGDNFGTGVKLPSSHWLHIFDQLIFIFLKAYFDTCYIQKRMRYHNFWMPCKPYELLPSITP